MEIEFPCGPAGSFKAFSDEACVYTQLTCYLCLMGSHHKGTKYDPLAGA